MPVDELPESFSFDPKRMLSVLAEHKVRFVVIGGIAAIFHASPYATFDLDVCPAQDDLNLERLAAALGELEARMRATDEPESLNVDFSPRILRSAPLFNLITTWGPLDIVNNPAGSAGYPDLSRGAVTVLLAGQEIDVASREDVLRSKEAVYREKDIPTVRLFRELEERDLEAKAKKPPTAP